MSTRAQRSFAGGELSPALHARVDVNKYQSGLARCLNFIVQRGGGLVRRPGLEYVCEGHPSFGVSNARPSPHRLIPWADPNGTSYVLLMHSSGISVVKDKTSISSSTRTITSVANSGSYWTVTHSGGQLSQFDRVTLSGISGGASVLNGREVYCRNPSGGTFRIVDRENNYISPGALSSGTGGTLTTVMRVTHPYNSFTSTMEARHSQNQFGMYFTSAGFQPRLLTRASETSWLFGTSGIYGSVSAPAIVLAAVPSPNWSIPAGNVAWRRYAVTAVDSTGSESVAAFGPYVTKSPAVFDNYVNLHTNNQSNKHLHSWLNFDDATVIGFEVLDRGWAQKWAIRGGSIANAMIGNSAIFTVYGTDFFGEYISESLSGANIVEGDSFDAKLVTVNSFRSIDRILSSKNYKGIHGPTPTVPSGVTFRAESLDWDSLRVHWNASPSSGIVSYRIYRSDGGLYGLVGETDTQTFIDAGLTPDYATVPPETRNAFPTSGSYPTAVSSYQQRILYGGGQTNPERMWATSIGSPGNLDRRPIISDDSSFFWEIAAEQRQDIMHLANLGKLLVFTTSGEWVAEGDQAGTITPTTINMRQVSHHGSSRLAPMVVGSSAVFYQPLGPAIRDLGSQWQDTGYQGNDLTVFSDHLFYGHSVASWAYQRAPESIIWCVRNDGIILGLTYVPEQQLWAWHRHEVADGIAIGVTAIPGTIDGKLTDMVYFIIQRTDPLTGLPVRTIERMGNTKYDDETDYSLMDCAVKIDVKDGATKTGQLTSTFATAVGGQMTVSSSASSFLSTQVGLRILGPSGQKWRIVTYTAANSIEVVVEDWGTATSGTIATGTWWLSSKTLSNIWPLAGRGVALTLDGKVHDNITLSSTGTYTLDEDYEFATVGIPYESQVETLNIDSASTESLMDKDILVSRVTCKIHKSGPALIGPNENGPFAEMKLHRPGTYGYTDALRTGDVVTIIPPDWKSNGKVFIKVTTSTPFELLAVAPYIDVTARRGR